MKSGTLRGERVGFGVGRGGLLLVLGGLRERERRGPGREK